MYKSILFILFCIVFQASFGQTDYVVTIKGDTLYGGIKLLSYDIVDRVQLTTTDKKKKSFTALEVKSVFLDREIYHSVRHTTRYSFMILKQSGYLSLYGFRIDNQMMFDGRYLVKRDGDAVEVPNITFKKTMQEFLKDCMSVSERIRSGELGRKNLDTLITLYNACIAENTRLKAQANLAALRSETSFPAIDNLKNRMESATISSKQDIVDLIKDIEIKLKGNQPIPNYLIEGLKGYLGDTEYQGDLEKLIIALNDKQ